MTENESLLEYCERAVKNCVEECGGACSLRIKECECVDANVLKHLRELEQYRAIGTVEEFKDLKEKSTPKKPILSKSMITEKEYQICPICERLALYDGIKFDYCQYCGQKLDWEGR